MATDISEVKGYYARVKDTTKTVYPTEVKDKGPIEVKDKDQMPKVSTWNSVRVFW